MAMDMDMDMIMAMAVDMDMDMATDMDMDMVVMVVMGSWVSMPWVGFSMAFLVLDKDIATSFVFHKKKCHNRRFQGPYLNVSRKDRASMLLKH